MSVGYALKGFWLIHLFEMPFFLPIYPLHFFLTGYSQGHVPARLGQCSDIAIWAKEKEPMLLLRTNFARSKKSPPALCYDVYAGVWRCGRRRRSNCIANSPGNEIKKNKNVSFWSAGRADRRIPRQRVSGHTFIVVVLWLKWPFERRWSWVSPFHLNRFA